MKFIILILAGSILAGASAFTSAYSRWWGEKSGRFATFILRNLLGIPLWFAGYVLAWRTQAPFLFGPSIVLKVIGTVLIIVGFIPAILGHRELGWRTHMPSVKDTLVRKGLYAHVRHPIYAGGFLMLVGLALIRPTSVFVSACALGFILVIVQARLEDIDLVQRLPEYKDYMKEVPRFLPRLRKRSG